MTPYPSPSPDKMLKPDEIAERMGVSKRTVLRWIEYGELSAYRVGSVTRIQHDDFQTFLRRHQTTKED